MFNTSEKTPVVNRNMPVSEAFNRLKHMLRRTSGFATQVKRPSFNGLGEISMETSLLGVREIK